MNNIINKAVYEMYKGKMCLKHTVEFYSPILDEKLGYQMFIGQTEDSEAHKKSMHDINHKIQDIIGDCLEVDIAKVKTSVLFGDMIDELQLIKENSNAI